MVDTALARGRARDITSMEWSSRMDVNSMLCTTPVKMSWLVLDVNYLYVCV